VDRFEIAQVEHVRLEGRGVVGGGPAVDGDDAVAGVGEPAAGDAAEKSCSSGHKDAHESCILWLATMRGAPAEHRAGGLTIDTLTDINE
jgi:hypothetical protein